MKTETLNENNPIIVHGIHENSVEISPSNFSTDTLQEFSKIESLVGETTLPKIPLLISIPESQSSEMNSTSSQSTVAHNSQCSEYIPSDQEQKTNEDIFIMPINRVCLTKSRRYTV